MIVIGIPPAIAGGCDRQIEGAAAPAYNAPQGMRPAPRSLIPGQHFPPGWADGPPPGRRQRQRINARRTNDGRNRAAHAVTALPGVRPTYRRPDRKAPALSLRRFLPAPPAIRRRRGSGPAAWFAADRGPGSGLQRGIVEASPWTLPPARPDTHCQASRRPVRSYRLNWGAGSPGKTPQRVFRL